MTELAEKMKSSRTMTSTEVMLVQLDRIEKSLRSILFYVFVAGAAVVAYVVHKW